jgi:cytochrome d ubiquinol oxidase subunit I
MGWVFTEMGRQPWVVFGVMTTRAGVSAAVGTASVVITLVGFTLIYGFLSVVDAALLTRFGKAEPPAPETPATVAIY